MSLHQGVHLPRKRYGDTLERLRLSTPARRRRTPQYDHDVVGVDSVVVVVVVEAVVDVADVVDVVVYQRHESP